MHEIKLQHSTISRIILEPKSGHDETEIKKEAALLALQLAVPVGFDPDNNGKEKFLSADELALAVPEYKKQIETKLM